MRKTTEIQIPDNVMAWHDDVLKDVADYVREADGDAGKIITAVEMRVEAEEGVTVTSFEGE